ncbi:MAG: 23S rRNA (pseudouridine(1915)-N(3))-methyltransferase RlmH [Alphaproteobacteria bacterium]|nr:23S rRNA (pseudouridine(1915)-N(3))-methyltransferase RlmH [Alphaproteobacteria bacterium]MBU0858702.1 23S rRNA (pseudouridine(1915)-N(3))-methyltransferase RlmH [Alphaproteobacteria bacterium]
MLRLELIAAEKLKTGPLLAVWDDYLKRLSWPLTLHEITAPDARQLEIKMSEKIREGAFVIALDERGKSLSSRDFAAKLEQLETNGPEYVQFIIGAADGIPAAIKSRANFLLSFGVQTWPHMMARVMLIEQIYRARQILDGHPYHRD